MQGTDWIDKLGLQMHPEGGYYRVTYIAETAIPKAALAAPFSGDRPVSTAIYFLLLNSEQERGRNGHFSAFHRIQSDEMWHFYAGSPLAVHVIYPNGSYERMLLGPGIEQRENFQAVVPAGCWFASEVLLADSFALAGCTVAPGFDFADFALAARSDLARSYPQHASLITRLTRE